MAYRYLDMERYPRRAHFDHFRAMPNPFVSVTVMVDVTELVALARAREASFYSVMIHAVARAADGVPQLRQRIRNAAIIEYDHCPTSHTEMLPDGTYAYCTLHHHMPLEAYLAYAEEKRRESREKASLEEDEDVESMYFISCLPWLHYTDLTMPIPAEPDESHPRITWGRYMADAAGRLTLPVTLQANHALVDGAHLAAFYDRLSRVIEGLADET